MRISKRFAVRWDFKTVFQGLSPDLFDRGSRLHASATSMDPDLFSLGVQIVSNGSVSMD